MKIRNKVIQTLVVVLLVASSLSVSIISAQAGINSGDNYPEPWRSAPIDSMTDNWHYLNRECTSWVAWALHDRNGFEIAALGNAANWGLWASENGYAVNSTPAVGAVAWWAADTLDNGYNVGSWGHVAYVKAVNSGGTVTIEEYNILVNGVPNGQYRLRTMAASNAQYIHFKDITQQVTIVSIAITSPATKLTYNVGDPLDISGIVVTGTYSGNSTQVESITVANITGFDSSAANPSETLTITYGGKTTTYNVQIVEDYTYTVTNGEAQITGYIGAGGDVTIPSTLGGVPVTSFGYGAFSSCTSLTGVSIPQGVTSIGDITFEGCTNLTSIIIPQGVVSIGSQSFSGCKNLTSVSLPQGVTSIGDFTFQDCTSLTSIIIPQGVISIGINTFSGCTSLTSVSIPESVTSIGIWAFEDCTSLTSIIVDANNSNYESIDGVLYNKAGTTLITCPGGLTSIIIPQGVTSISINAFKGCKGLTTVSIPQGVTYIGMGAFQNCTGLANISLPQGLVTIDVGAFENCTGLTSISIPQTVTIIGDMAFTGCTGLTSISIPQGVTNVGGQAFQNCTALTSITFNSATTSILDSAGTTIPATTKIIGYDPSTAKDYAAQYGRTFESLGLAPVTLSSIAITTPATKLTYTVGDPLDLTGLVVTGTCSDSSTQVETITSADVTGFDSSTVNPAETLTITYGGQTTTYTVAIQQAAQDGDYTYTVTANEAQITGYTGAGGDITIPDTLGGVTVTSIGKMAFYDCTSLTGITIQYGVNDIGDSAFESCTNLISVSLPESLTSIDYWAFQGCSSLSSINLPSSLISIGQVVFGDCTKLTSITIPSNVTSIGFDAFGNCSNLTSITFNSATTAIYDDPSTIPAVTTIIGYDPSTAKDYATKYGRTFELIGTTNTLTSIAITTPATKLTYTVGDTLDITGLVVTGTCSDSSTQVETITSADVTGFDSSTVNPAETLTVTCGGKTTTYTVAIQATLTTGLTFSPVSGSAITASTPITITVSPALSTSEAVYWNTTGPLPVATDYLYQNTGFYLSVSGTLYAAVYDSSTGLWSTPASATFTVSTASEDTDATLSALASSAGTLSPAFAPTTTTYSVVLPAGTTTVPTITATVNDTGKATDVVTPAASLPGSTTVVVTAQDGQTTKTYTINFTVAVSHTISIGAVDATPGATVSVPISVDNPDGMAGYELEIQYDPSVLTPSATAQTGTAGGVSVPTYNPSYSTDSIFLSWAGSSALTSGGSLAIVSFTVNNNATMGNTTTLSWDMPDIVVNDINGEGIADNFNFTNGTITMATVTPVTGVTLNKTTDTVAVGATDQLTATITPTNATNQILNWASNNTAVATVDQTGKVKAVGEGTANITATTTDGSNIAAPCAVNSIMYGDVNGTGKINSGDATLVLRYCARLTTLTSTQLIAADVNGGSSVNSGDATLILRYAARLISTFPVQQ